MLFRFGKPDSSEAVGRSYPGNPLDTSGVVAGLRSLWFEYPFLHFGTKGAGSGKNQCLLFHSTFFGSGVQCVAVGGTSSDAFLCSTGNYGSQYMVNGEGYHSITAHP